VVEEEKLKKDKWHNALYAFSSGSDEGKKLKNYTHKGNSETVVLPTINEILKLLVILIV